MKEGMRNEKPTKFPHLISSKCHLVPFFNLGPYLNLLHKPLVNGKLIANHPMIIKG
jgi:hypothetical protein